MPNLLDLCCRAGGATMGYVRAGFEVTGVDIVDRSAVYPGQHFVQGDALEYVEAYGADFDFIHASWPCQAHCTLTKGTNSGRLYLDLIAPGREIMRATGRPWVIENVPASPLRRDLVLCGEMFGLGVIRHRVFEFSDPSLAPSATHKPHRGHVAGWRHGEWFDGPYLAVYGNGGGKGSVADWQQAMGIDWTADRMDLAEAIPPAYTEFIGRSVSRDMVKGE